MDPLLSAIPVALFVGGISFCVFYFMFPLRTSGSVYDSAKFGSVTRRSLLRACAPFVLTLLVLGFRRELGGLFARSRHRTKSETRVWVNTRSGFYYCADTKAYGNLKPGTYMAESDALQNGYQPFSGPSCE